MLGVAPRDDDLSAGASNAASDSFVCISCLAALARVCRFVPLPDGVSAFPAFARDEAIVGGRGTGVCAGAFVGTDVVTVLEEAEAGEEPVTLLRIGGLGIGTGVSVGVADPAY